MKKGKGKTEEKGKREKGAGAFTALSPVGSTMSGTQ